MKLLEAALEHRVHIPTGLYLQEWMVSSASFQEIFLLKIHVSMSG